MKKLAVGMAMLFGIVVLQPAHAEVKPSIVIIDTAIDSTNSQIKNNLIYEVCTLESSTCPNGKLIQEGIGSASLPVSQAYSNGFEHGTIMASIVTQIDPKASIIFIRIAGMLKSGAMDSFSDKSVTKALDWVIANKTKFNIVSVSASVGSHVLNSGVNYCPIKATNQPLVNDINTLVTLGVPTMFASGNNMDIARVDYPACIPSAIAVSAVNEKTAEGYRIATYANTGPDVDFYALGTFNTSIQRAVGTSASAAALSGYWAKNYKGTYQSTYDYMKTIMQPTQNTKINAKTFIDVLN
jgi:hypothetical protein